MEELKELLNNELELTAKLDEVNKDVTEAVNDFINKGNVTNISLDESNNIKLDKLYEKELYDIIIQEKKLSEKIAKRKEEIKAFIEENKLGSFETNLLTVKYTSATTTTTLDTTRLKKEKPELAAEYSKVSARSSSISINPNTMHLID